MKKLLLGTIVALILNSCVVGTYLPNVQNNYGTQTQVVLSQANFRIVRDVEVIIEVNNSRLKRQDVEKSAYGELVRQYKLTGSQAFINVSIEEVRREKYRLFGFNDRKQYVAARATIIEFLQPNGEPIKSVETPYSTTVESTPVTKVASDKMVTLTPEQVREREYYQLAYLYKIGNINLWEYENRYDTNRIKTLASKYTSEELLNLYNNITQ